MSRPRLVYGDGPWAPTVDPATVAARCGLDDPDVLLGWTVEELPQLARGRTSVPESERGDPADLS